MSLFTRIVYMFSIVGRTGAGKCAELPWYEDTDASLQENQQ